MPTLQIEIARDPNQPDEIWQKVADVIERAFSISETADVSLIKKDLDTVAIEVRVDTIDDELLVKLSLETPAWRTDP